MSSSRGERTQRATSIARRSAFCALALALAAALAGPAEARAPKPPASHLPPRLEIRGDRIGFYPYQDATLLSAEGHVRMRAGRRSIVADSMRLDLKTNKIVASGNVVVSGVGNVLYATAYALDLASDKAEVIRLDPTPRTLAVDGDDLAHAKEGPAPSDTFGIADLTGQRPYIESRHAVVQTNANVRMSPAEFPTAAGARGVLPTFVYTYQYNQLLGQGQALPTTTIDYPYTLFGTPNSLTALHARYGQYDGVELGVDERLVDGNREYVVGSILPFRGRRADLNAFQQIRSGLSHTFAATFAASNVLADYQIQQTAREFSIKAETRVANNYNYENLTLGTVGARIRHLFSYQVLAGYGYDHNPGQYPFAGDFHKDLTLQIFPKSVQFKNGISASAQYNYFLTKYDTPHLVTRSVETVSLSSPTIRISKRRPDTLQLVGSASIENDAFRFRDDAPQFLYLPDPGSPYFAPDGTLDTGYFAYNGLSTLRTYSLTSTFQGPHDFVFSLTLTHMHDFPQGHGIGRAPLYAYGRLGLRLTSSLRAEIGRSYTFGVNGQRYSQYAFTISP